MSQCFSLCEVAANNGKNGKPIWLIVKGVVYDMSKFVKEHPGGEESILEYAGRDATKAFNDVGHSTDAIREMKLYKIGVVATCSETAAKLATAAETTTTASKTNAALDKQIESQKSCTRAQKKRIKFFFCF